MIADLFPLATATLAAVTCGLLGNFLVLRRLSLMGDAISHSVLPGLVIAFLIAASKHPIAMLAGAATAGIITVVLVELVKKLGRVEPGAAMGVVFSLMFALGILLIERSAVRHADLDADCVLHGQLEMLMWYSAPDHWSGVFSWATLEAVPRQLTTLAATWMIALAFVALFFKELRIAAFDPALATTQGFNATFMHYALMILVASATVASFEAVGSILVIAMLICPAATARLLSDRLLSQVLWSVAIATACGVVGYIGASAVPGAFGKDAVNAAGSMAVVAGLLLGAATIAAPRHGLVARLLHRRRVGLATAREDLLAALYRAEESGGAGLSTGRLGDLLVGSSLGGALRGASRERLVRRDGDRVTLTDAGRRAAAELVRTHRLWESYLVDQVGLSPDHVHDTAERLEHVGVRPREGPAVDPHGRRIPRRNG